MLVKVTTVKSVIVILLLFWSNVSFSKESQFIASVTGMTCPMCASAVENKVKKIKGVKSVSVDISNGTVLIVGHEIHGEKLKKAINTTRFKVTKINKKSN